MPDSSVRKPSSPSGFEAAYPFLVTAAILVFAPLFRSGQPALAQLVLQLLAVALLGLSLRARQNLPVSRPEMVAAISLLLMPLVFLIPLPSGLVDWLPGRDIYASIQAQLGIEAGVRRLSVLPHETESAWLLALIPIAVFFGVRSLDFRGLRRLLWVLFAIAAGQAILGLMQYGGQSDLLYLGMEPAYRTAVGTYTNRNHLAGLLVMVLPIALALLIYSVGRHGHRQTQWRKRMAFFGTLRGHTAIGYGALALLFITAIVFTRSRAGIALAMLGILLATLAYSRRIGGNNVYGLVGTVVAIAIGVGLVIGLAPVLDRFSVSDTVENARWTVFSATLTGIGHFFPLGSGPGTYPEVFNAFQPLELGRWFVNRAHNDYLEWLFDGGAFAAVLILFLLGLYLRQWTKVWTSEAWSQLRFIQVGAGIGILLILGHSLVDYNLHTPANIVYAALLAGIFFADSALGGEATGARRRTRGRSPARQDVPRPASPTAAPGVPPEQIRNPFLD